MRVLTLSWGRGRQAAPTTQKKEKEKRVKGRWSEERGRGGRPKKKKSGFISDTCRRREWEKNGTLVHTILGKKGEGWTKETLRGEKGCRFPG